MLIRHGGILANRLYLTAPPLLTQHNGAAIVEAEDVERVLTDIDIAGGAGARTIPLADIGVWRGGKLERSPGIDR
jgi:hypothetical protein